MKRYDGYRAYDYLKGDPGYRRFDPTPEVGRVASYLIDLTPEDEGRVHRLLAQQVTVSLHEHPIARPLNLEEYFDYRRQGRDVTAYVGLSLSGLDAVFDNLMDGNAVITSQRGWKWHDVLHDLGMRLADLAHQSMVFQGRTAADIRLAKETGRIAWFPSLEAATPIENELDRIDVLYGLGVRCMGVAYTEGNSLGAGLREPHDGGLTVFGRQAVRRMNQLGLLVDVSHAGDQTALDTIEASSSPVVITHAGARALWPSRRMKPDEVIRACAERGGVIGIEAAPHTTLTQKHPSHSIESVMEHFEYCVNLVGIEHVAFGPDTMFGDHVGSHRVFGSVMSKDDVSFSGPDHPTVEYVAGLENPGENFLNITRWLVKHGYPDDQIGHVLGGNAMRVLDAVLT